MLTSEHCIAAKISSSQQLCWLADEGSLISLMGGRGDEDDADNDDDDDDS